MTIYSHMQICGTVPTWAQAAASSLRDTDCMHTGKNKHYNFQSGFVIASQFGKYAVLCAGLHPHKPDCEPDTQLHQSRR